MNILITIENGENRKIYFPKPVLDAFGALGNVRINHMDRRFTERELAENIKGMDICVTHWGCPRFTREVLENAGDLKLIAHAAGSVANIVTDEVYARGIKVCSANTVMARYVAEGILGYILAGLRMIPQHDMDMKVKKTWVRRVTGIRSLFDEKIGFIGLGTVGARLLELLQPFNAQIRIYDPFISDSFLQGINNVRLCGLEEVLSWGNILSVHASLTPDTHHMIDKERLKLVRNGALLINAARGAIIDEGALTDELKKGRFNAVLDVYEEEPLKTDSSLRELENVILMPHMAGAPAREQMTVAMCEEIGRFICGEPLRYEISYAKYKLMTRE